MDLMASEVQLNIDEVLAKIDWIVEDSHYLLNDPGREFCYGEREMIEANYKLFKDVKRRLKAAKVY